MTKLYLPTTIFSVLLSLFTSNQAWALQTTTPASNTDTASGELLLIFLCFLMIFLAAVIYVLSDLIIKIANSDISKNTNKGQKTLMVLLPFIFSVFFANTAFAQTTTTAATTAVDQGIGLFNQNYGDLPGGVFWLSILVLAIEFGVIFYLLTLLNKFLKVPSAANQNIEESQKEPSIWQKWWVWFSDLKPMEREKDIMFDHDFDGIRELDNSVPPWMRYGFYFTILFGIFYLYRYHVVQTAPLQLEELALEYKAAEAEIAKLHSQKGTAAIDENTVTLLTDNPSVENGKTLYINTCAACHGQKGEGGVGPNLTDDYWIHGGSLKDIFKTVKYGVPDKGMVPWQTTLSGTQMQQVSSFVKTLHGTNPSNAKEKQGELFKENADSAAVNTPAKKDTATAK
ncbi:MAG: c-type cytochrome [Sphingobacteriales bacterium]|jgi:cytochrome c oxidase cbb3-type subunit 3|nr:c-type cytochrome [Sphingobacteriales bacterium]MDA0197685.1 c-type cytochrome [Bacteroidota bacterium]